MLEAVPLLGNIENNMMSTRNDLTYLCQFDCIFLFFV